MMHHSKREEIARERVTLLVAYLVSRSLYQTMFVEYETYVVT